MRSIGQSVNHNSPQTETDLATPLRTVGQVREYAAPMSPLSSTRVLPESEVVRLTQLARGVVQSLRLFLRAQPEQTVRGLALTLRVDQSLVQRTLAGLGDGSEQDPLGALVKLPPVTSLRKLLVSTRGGDPSTRDTRAAAVAAVSALDKAVHELGGPRRFKLRLGQATKRRERNTGEINGADANGLMHGASAAIAGSDCRAKFRVNIVWPDATAPGRYNNALAGGAVGTRLQRGGMPMYGFTDLGGGAKENGTGHGLGPTLLRLEEWCTPDLATSTRETLDGGSVVVVDDHRAAGPEGVNLTLGNLTQFEPESARLFISLVSPILTPSRRLVADVYVDRSLAMRLVPRAGVFINTPALMTDPCAAWRMQLPQRIMVEALGTGMSRASTDAWEGHAELSRGLAQRVGVDPASLVGFRIDVANPLWGMAYCMWFDMAEAFGG